MKKRRKKEEKETEEKKMANCTATRWLQSAPYSYITNTHLVRV